MIGEQALDEYIIISDTGSRNEKISLMCLFTFIYFSRYSLLSFARSFSVSTALVGGLTLLLFAVSLILYTAGGLDHISFDGIVLIACAWLFFAVTLRLWFRRLKRCRMRSTPISRAFSKRAGR